MAISRRSSTENIFKVRNDVKVQPQTKEAEPVVEEIKEKPEVKPEVKPVMEEKSGSPSEKPAKAASNRSQSRSSNTNKNDALFKDSKKEHGVQRTTYYEKDVYDYIEQISKKYDINFNKVVNKILRDYMSAE